jgi:hypothetical protein
MSVRAFVRRALGGGPPPPILSPAEVATQKFAREQTRRRDAAAVERAYAVQGRRDAEQHEAEEWAERRRQSQAQIRDACERFGFWFPTDSYGVPRDRLGGVRRRHPFVASVLDALGFGGRA